MTDWWTGNNKKVAADTKTVYDFAYKVIHRRRALEEKTGVEGGGVVHELREGEGDEIGKTGVEKPGVLSGSGKDLIQLFMEATDDKGDRLTDDGLKDTLINFLLVSCSPLAFFFFVSAFSFFVRIPRPLFLPASVCQEELITVDFQQKKTEFRYSNEAATDLPTFLFSSFVFSSYNLGRKRHDGTGAVLDVLPTPPLPNAQRGPHKAPRGNRYRPSGRVPDLRDCPGPEIHQGLFL